MQKSIADICAHLEALAKFQNDLFVFSFCADGKSYLYKVFNKGEGREGILLKDFDGIEDVEFTDTVNRAKTTALEYFRKNLFSTKNGDGEIIVAFDGKTKTMHMIVVHNTNLGPALGGYREKDYSTFDSMLTDTLRLARGMTYKSALAETKTGGGKSTRTLPKGARLDANLGVARICNFINEHRKNRGLNLYVIAEDSNTHCQDFDEIDTVNPNNTCKSLHMGGTGNPSPITAIGVVAAAKTAAEYAFPDKSLKNKTVLLSGVGQVGYEVLKNFVHGGVAKVICAEMSADRIEWVKKQFHRMDKKHKIEFIVYTKEELGSQKFLHDLANEIDIFCPCSLGRSINDTNIDAIKGTRLKLICGAENNQLADEEKHGRMLHEMGILYVPDFVVNAGGLIHCSHELPGRTFLISESIDLAKNIGNNVRKVIELSKKENIPTYLAANKLAESRFLK